MLSRRNFLRVGVGAGATLFLATACGDSTTAPAGTNGAVANTNTKKIVLRLSHSHVEGNTALDVFARKFKELAATKTNGQVEIQIFANNVLGQEKEIVQQIQQGLVDFMASGSAIWGSIAPKVQILDLPFLWQDYNHIHKAMDGEVGQELAKYLEEKAKARPLAWFDSFGFRNVVTRNKEVKTLDDLKGLKLRTIQSPIYVKAIELMGASPTPMALGEVYTSLQTGVIDGYEHDANTTLSQKYFEVAKNVTRTTHIAGLLTLSASAQKFNSLPADLKKQLEEAAREAATFQRSQAPIEDEKALTELKTKGMKVFEMDRKPLIAKAESFWSSYGKEVEAEDLVKKITALNV